MVEPFPRPTDGSADRIASELEQDIVFGRLLPAQKLREEELSARFMVSRHQVRAALASLERVGIVTKERNKGAAVRSFTSEEVQQICEIREMLQRQAALRIPLPVDPSTITKLEEIQARYEAAILAGDYSTIHRTNDQFHTELFCLCGNLFLSQLIRQYMDLSYVIRANAFSPEHLLVARTEHRLMLRLLGSTDSWALAQLCVDHIQYSKHKYLAMVSLPDSERQPPWMAEELLDRGAVT